MAKLLCMFLIQLMFSKCFGEQAVQYYYCGYKTFVDTSISVSTDAKFIIDITADFNKNISILSDTTSFVVDITGCITPIDEIADAVAIEIQYKDLPVIYNGAIQNLDNLKFIKMEYCQINELKPGAFLKIPSIDSIFLRFNQIERIEMGVFNNLQIKNLYLGYNNISYMNANAFDYMPNLAVVELDGNKLKSWNTDWFSNTPNVEQLCLDFNLLTSIPANAFNKLKNSYSTSISLSNNQIIYIHPTAFSSLNLLYTLWLDNNFIFFLDDDVFKHLERIYVLSLRGNQMSCLSDELLYNLQSPEVILHVEDNEPMKCECFKAIENWAKINDNFFTQRFIKIEYEKRLRNGLKC